MKMNTTFEVVAKCYEFTESKDLLNLEKYRNAPIEDITLNIDRISASCFLFRNQRSVFRVNNFVVNLKYDNHNTLAAIILISENKILYYVINPDELFNNILEGFIRLRTLDKISSLLELDFEDTRREDDEGLIDEFDLEEEME